MAVPRRRVYELRMFVGVVFVVVPVAVHVLKRLVNVGVLVLAPEEHGH